MRHRKSGRTFGRNSSHRKAMFRNMVTSLIEHGRIKTTKAKARELRRFVEKTIAWGTSLGILALRSRDESEKERPFRDKLNKRLKDFLTPEERAQVIEKYKTEKAARHNKKDSLTKDEKAKIVHHYRMAKRLLPNRELLTKLFQEIAPLYLNDKGEVLRNGGYTRVVKGANRRGDNASMAIIELMDYEFETPIAESVEEKED